jgi:hypothetical protein
MTEGPLSNMIMEIRNQKEMCYERKIPAHLQRVKPRVKSWRKSDSCTQSEGKASQSDIRMNETIQSTTDFVNHKKVNSLAQLQTRQSYRKYNGVPDSLNTMTQRTITRFNFDLAPVKSPPIYMNTISNFRKIPTKFVVTPKHLRGSYNSSYNFIEKPSMNEPKLKKPKKTKEEKARSKVLLAKTKKHVETIDFMNQ